MCLVCLKQTISFNQFVILEWYIFSFHDHHKNQPIACSAYSVFNVLFCSALFHAVFYCGTYYFVLNEC